MEKPGKNNYPQVREISVAEHVDIVKEIFATITPRYDFLNHLMSLGRDIAWRRFSARKMRFFRSHRMLDVATGTADLALAVADQHPVARITGVDLVQTMICAGLRKIRVKGLSDRMAMLGADALHLPFSDNTFDVAAIAFGIRNIPDKIAVLHEMNRVVVPGGQVIVLEMTLPRNGPFRHLLHTYLNLVLPRMGRMFSPNPGAYRYLGDSIIHFPAPDTLAAWMEKAGLQEVQKYSLTLGITHLHIGMKPAH